jgi:hypothetical protein
MSPHKNWQFQNIFGILAKLLAPKPVLPVPHELAGSKVEGFMRGSVIPAKAGIHFEHLVIRICFGFRISDFGFNVFMHFRVSIIEHKI